MFECFAKCITHRLSITSSRTGFEQYAEPVAPNTRVMAAGGKERVALVATCDGAFSLRQNIRTVRFLTRVTEFTASEPAADYGKSEGGNYENANCNDYPR